MQQPKFDQNVRPQDDFFGYVNNDWLTHNPIPSSENSWGTFYVLRDQAWRAVSDIITTLKNKDEASLNGNQPLLKRFFDSALDFAEHETQHLETLKAEQRKIEQISSKEELAQYLGYAHRHELNMFWAVFVGLDDKNSQIQVLNLHQRGLGMPNRDYYLEDSKQMKQFRAAYDTYRSELTALFPELPQVTSEAVFGIERKLATASWTDIALRDVEKNYNHFTLAELRERFPTFAWDQYFESLGWKSPSDNIVIGQPSFIKECLRLITDEPLETIKQYLSWRLRSGFANWVSKATLQKSFAFYETALNGVTEMKPLWKRSVMTADALVIGEALGREYAARHFPSTSKKEVSDLVEDIRAAYHARIERLTWMQPETKKLAHKKLDNIKVFIGYPSKWRSIDTLDFSANDVIKNILNARGFDAQYELDKIGKPPAKEEWEMNAHTVNAYHHPNRLEIVFPAAILQPPFYDPQASYAANLGGIGAVIGHEFTHGFDDQGAQFDEHGNVKQWQSDAERKSFSDLAQLIVKQANTFETVPGTHLQGELVLGEAIADIGGLQLAVEALMQKNASEQDYKDLFVNFANAECGHATTERLIQLAKVDPHPPSPFRVNAVVNHIDKFYELYDMTDADKLYRTSDARAQIW
jgi:putative endopeptidase